MWNRYYKDQFIKLDLKILLRVRKTTTIIMYFVKKKIPVICRDLLMVDKAPLKNSAW
jgi:hypothetical protein